MCEKKNQPRAVIYQLFVRTFGNLKDGRRVDGSFAENGCGKFSDINTAALKSIAEMGFTHLWLTGVIEQASATGYPERPGDVADILKGKAGSPYAIKDYFDVCPDYADVPAERLEEFKKLVSRCHHHGFRVLIDFVPNHVARSYRSSVQPDFSFGEGDLRDVFFDRENHFYYLGANDAGGGPPLRLPTKGLPGCSGFFEEEKMFGRVTGNNAVTWAPSIHDWYETVKLNYGHDFTKGRDTHHLPSADAAEETVPKTWRTMDRILAYWQEMGVDGFRVDMAHIVPMEFWRWVVRRARRRDSNVFFMAEAYDSDPSKLTDRDVLEELSEAGFDGSYEHPTYKILQGIYESGKWANDIDAETFNGKFLHQCIRYIENHDEVRVANPQCWGGVGMEAGRPAAGVMFGISRAATMIYNGQEIGEPAIGQEGFSGDDGRTSIFDYTAMPEFQKWVNGGRYDGGRLSSSQEQLRAWYGRLIHVLREPAFCKGEFYGLNHANKTNEKFGRIPGESTSGHWLYAFLRKDFESGQTFFCVVNFHPSEVLHDVRVLLPWDAIQFLGCEDSGALSWSERMNGNHEVEAQTEAGAASLLLLGNLSPCEVRYYELN